MSCSTHLKRVFEPLPSVRLTVAPGFGEPVMVNVKGFGGLVSDPPWPSAGLRRRKRGKQLQVGGCCLSIHVVQDLGRTLSRNLHPRSVLGMAQPKEGQTPRGRAAFEWQPPAAWRTLRGRQCATRLQCLATWQGVDDL